MHPARHESDSLTLPPISSHLRRPDELLIAAGIVLGAIAVRLPLLSQSLWYDEMYTIMHYVHQPLRQIFVGEYAPNNHTLHSLLVKATEGAAVRLGLATRGPLVNEPLLRLPSMLAGSLVGIALAWPLRRRQPWAALLLALFISFNPWLVIFSGEARGYTLLLLFGILATNALPDRKSLISLPYSLALFAAVATIPIAVTLAIGHGFAAWFLHRPAFSTWLRSATLAALLSILLYGPAVPQMLEYLQDPVPPTITYAQFLDRLPRYVATGMPMPGLSGLILPLLILMAGTVIAWRSHLLRDQLLGGGVALGLGLVAPLAIPSAQEVRFMPWLIPVFSIAMVATLTDVWSQRLWRPLAAVALLAFISLFVQRLAIAARLPHQPIRDAILLASRQSPPDTRVILLYTGSWESHFVYSAQSSRPMSYAYFMTDLVQIERDRPTEVWMLVVFDKMMQHLEPRLWLHLQRNWVVSHELPGRLGPVLIYRYRSASAEK